MRQILSFALWEARIKKLKKAELDLDGLYIPFPMLITDIVGTFAVISVYNILETGRKKD